MAETHVEIKESAIKQNQAVKEYVAQHESLVTFQSLADAEDFAGEMTTAGEQPVGLQNTAPQDTTDADLYLVYQSTRQTHTPYEPEADTWTFDITANQYGAIGEALITAPGVPALRHYVEEHLAPDAGDIRVSSKSVYWALQDGTLTEETLDGLY